MVRVLSDNSLSMLIKSTAWRNITENLPSDERQISWLLHSVTEIILKVETRQTQLRQEWLTMMFAIQKNQLHKENLSTLPRQRFMQMHCCALAMVDFSKKARVPKSRVLKLGSN